MIYFLIGLIIWLQLLNQLIGLFGLISENRYLLFTYTLVSGILIVINLSIKHIISAVLNMAIVALTLLFIWSTNISISKRELFWTSLSSNYNIKNKGYYKRSENL